MEVVSKLCLINYGIPEAFMKMQLAGSTAAYVKIDKNHDRSKSGFLFLTYKETSGEFVSIWGIIWKFGDSLFDLNLFFHEPVVGITVELVVCFTPKRRIPLNVIQTSPNSYRILDWDEEHQLDLANFPCSDFYLHVTIPIAGNENFLKTLNTVEVGPTWCLLEPNLYKDDSFKSLDRSIGQKTNDEIKDYITISHPF